MVTMNKNLIYKDNKIIEACYKLTLNETRIVLMAISHVNSAEKLSDNSVFTLTAEEYSSVFSMECKEAFRQMKEAMDELGERWIKVIDDGNRLKKLRWISMKSSTGDKQSIAFRFDSTITEYLSELTGEFTKYKLLHISGMQSVYSIRIYEMLMRWKNKKVVTISVEDFKERLELTSESYKLFGSIKQKVITPAMREIEQHSDIIPSYELIKKGTKVVSIKLRFEYKEGRAPKDELKKDALKAIKHIKTLVDD